MGTPSDEYISTGFNVVKKRIAIGGYRLAKLIKDIKASYDNQKNINEKELIEKVLEFLK